MKILAQRPTHISAVGTVLQYYREREREREICTHTHPEKRRRRREEKKKGGGGGGNVIWTAPFIYFESTSQLSAVEDWRFTGGAKRRQVF